MKPDPPIHARIGRRRALPAAALAALFAAFSGCGKPVAREASWTVLGAPAHASVRTLTAEGAVELLAELRAATERVERLVGPGDDTALAALQREAPRDYHRVEERDLWRTLLLALDYARTSEGLYDPTLGAVHEAPPEEKAQALAASGWHRVATVSEARAVRFADPGLRLDLDGLDRGLALDVAARRFATGGVRGALVRVGDVRYAWGEPLEGELWRLPIDDPREPGRPLLVIEVATRAVATCGVPWHPGNGGRPVLDPVTGEPPAAGVAVAVAIAHSGVDAAALCRALLVGGRSRGGAFLERTRKTEAVLITSDDPPEVLASATLDGRLELAGELAGASVRSLLPPVPGRERPDSEPTAPLVH